MNEEVKAINRTGVILLLAMVCCFLWGSATPSIKTGYEMFAIQGDDTWSIILFAGVRFFLAGLLVILFESLHQKRFVLPEAGSAPYIVKLALAQTIIQYFFFYIGLAHTSGVTGTILSGSGGFISIILVCIVLRSERLSANKIVGVILGFSGIIIMNISFNGDTSAHFTLLGEGFVLLSQISYAMSGIMVKRYSQRYPVTMLSGYQFMLGGLVMAIVGFAAGGRMQMDAGPVGYVLLLYMALISAVMDAGPVGYVLLLYMALISAVAYTLWGTLLKYNPVSRVAIFNFLTPLWGTILSAIFLGEVEQALQINKMVALVLVSLGIYIVNRAPATRQE